MKFFLILLVLLALFAYSEASECRTDSDCTDNKLCVNGDCLLSNHRSGRVVITDQNVEDQCTPDCPTGQKCVAGVCVPES